MFFTPFGVQIPYVVLKAWLVLVLRTLASCMHVRGVYVELPQCSAGELFIYFFYYELFSSASEPHHCMLGGVLRELTKCFLKQNHHHQCLRTEALQKPR